jgi:uncharacterized protein (TIGR03000 family)
MLACEPDYQRDRRNIFRELESKGDIAFQHGDRAGAQQTYKDAERIADGADELQEIRSRITRLSDESPPADSTALSRPAVLTVHLPDTAELEFDGIQFAGAGEKRRIETPKLKTGKPYQATLRARWTEDGESRTKQKVVTFYAGQEQEVDLTSP